MDYKSLQALAFQLTTSRRGRQQPAGTTIYDRCISTHDLTKRSTGKGSTAGWGRLNFNSRPHEEVDIIPTTGNFARGIFQLTTSRRGRRFPLAVCLIAQILFQLTTSRRGRRSLSGFRSRSCGISTHDLTKRSTVPWFMVANTASAFQLTTSRRGRQAPAAALPTVRRFQLTTSRRGRRPCRIVPSAGGRFQLTTSRRGRHNAFDLPSLLFQFQLTTSRRGRRSSTV